MSSANTIRNKPVEAGLTISMVPMELVYTVAKPVAELMDKAVPYTNGRYRDGNDVVKECEQGFASLWIAYDSDMNIKAAATTVVAIYPGCKKLMVKFVAGVKMKLWIKDLSDTLHRFAFEAGCDGIEAIGRPQWLAMFPNVKPVAIFMETMP